MLHETNWYGTAMNDENESLSISIADDEQYRYNSDRTESALWDANTPKSNDGRSITQTKFYAQEADSDTPVRRDNNWMGKWEWLGKLNDGHRSSDNQGRIEKANARRDLETWLSQLDANDFQKNRALEVYDSRSRNPDGDGYVGGIRKEIILLAVITLILNEDGRRVRSENKFQKMRDTLEVSKKELKNGRKRIHELL